VENKNWQINQVSNELEEVRGKIRFLNADAIEERELQGKEIIRQLNEQNGELKRKINEVNQEILTKNQEIKMLKSDVLFISYFSDQLHAPINLLSTVPSEENTWAKMKQMIKSLLNNISFMRLHWYDAAKSAGD